MPAAGPELAGSAGAAGAVVLMDDEIAAPAAGEGGRSPSSSLYTLARRSRAPRERNLRSAPQTCCAQTCCAQMKVRSVPRRAELRGRSAKQPVLNHQR